MIPPPFKNYIGSKNADGTYQTIINHIPPHDNYFELYLGTGAVMRKKQPASGFNVGCDIDPKVFSKWQKLIQKLPMGYIIKNQDARSLLQNIELIPGRNMIYLDPPYPIPSRKQKVKQYKYEMTIDDHKALLDLIVKKSDKRSVECYNWKPTGDNYFMISTYPNKLYAEKLKDWTCIDYQVITRGGTLATELLYMNYAIPAELHEYTYLGSDFREREKIKRANLNLIKKISSWPTSRQKMILQQIKDEFFNL